MTMTPKAKAWGIAAGAAMGVAVICLLFAESPDSVPLNSKLTIPVLPSSLAASSPRPSKVSAQVGSHSDKLEIPERMRAQISRLREDTLEDRRNWAQVIETGWNDFGRAVELIDANFPRDERDRRVADLLRMLCAERIEFLTDGLQYLAAPTRASLIDSTTTTWARRDPRRLVSYAEASLTGDARSAALSRAASALGGQGDWALANETLARIPFSRAREQCIRALANAMGGGHVDEALKWIESFELPEERMIAAQAAIGKLKSQMSVEQLVQMANSTTNDSIRAMATTAIVEKTLDKDVDSALRWAVELPAPAKAPAQRQVAEKLARENRIAEATSLALTIQAGEQRSWALDSIGRTLYASGPQAVAAWVATLKGDAQQRAAAGLVGRWYDSDSIAVSEWINRLPAGDTRDRAISTLVSRLATSDPAAALDAAKAIQNPRIKQGALSMIQR